MYYNWPTKERDLQVARAIMQEYASEQSIDSLGLFEIVVDPAEKRMDFRLSRWVVALARHFMELYGSEQGHQVTRQVISACIRQNETIH